MVKVMFDLPALEKKYPLPEGYEWKSNEGIFLIGIVDKKSLTPEVFQIWTYKDGDVWTLRSYDRERGKVQVGTQDDALNVVYTRFLLGDF